MFLRGGMTLFSVWWWGRDVPQRWDDSCFQSGGEERMFLRGGMADVFCVVVGDGCSSEVGWQLFSVLL